MAEGEEELKSLLIKVKEESEKASLKLSMEKTKIMASSLIISWQIGGETMETVTDFIFLGSKITADGTAAMKLSFKHQLPTPPCPEAPPLSNPLSRLTPTPVLLPVKSHDQRSLAGYSPFGCKELDMT